MTEVSDFGAVVLVVATGFALAIPAIALTRRLPVPTAAVFLVGAAIVSALWPRLHEAVPTKALERVAIVALIVILFNGGMDIGWRRLRASAGPILALGIGTTFATAGLTALFAHVALGFGWTVSGLIGAALAPTDPAVMFSVLGESGLSGRVRTMLEGEAGVNDPAGVALMLGMIELAQDHGSAVVIAREFAVEMSVGAAIGFAGAFLIVRVLARLPLPRGDLQAVFALALVGCLYGVTSLAHGSGLLAVFIAGLFLGDARGPHQRPIELFHGSAATLAEIVVFVVLGLTESITSLSGAAVLEGAALACMLAVVIRPAAVFAVLAPVRMARAERAFIALSGLKGAVPILLAAFALLAEVEDAQRIYDIVFVVVVLSVTVQGTLLPFSGRALGIQRADTDDSDPTLSPNFGSDQKV